jgi:hypothetical protein
VDAGQGLHADRADVPRHGQRHHRVADSAPGRVQPAAADRSGPELNPTENIWSSLKRSMANLAPGSITDLHRIAKNRLKAMQYKPALIDGFLTATGLAPP